ncbi:hypothetical protein [Streptomyces acidiscabies]|uniref:Uncharacterized protein n=1 Tax=Streptomyces acidiscabies TaxID=42234 RepID=A0AAP6EG33_9ACTN|nr:hypothetical protein [Streptomyces acidiscabies]MBP5938010.1 hypothetical protein [Streptomyces sp. LBUM 1476]MBZ3909012.1 hypothetical protein [Streptomyces acidiscabies]MDX2961548.1 hypothetical protein [Streptomyces acidiscabies]MDX3016584.1 hypothetical protein [Streptomyces acidiscabies]MDX3788511.1 hypothetical protein [Streptomyces acidiscabies]
MEAHRHSTEEARGENLAPCARALSGPRTHGAEVEALPHPAKPSAPLQPLPKRKQGHKHKHRPPTLAEPPAPDRIDNAIRQTTPGSSTEPLPPKAPRDGRTRPLHQHTTPQPPKATQHLSPDGAPPRRRASAALLAEGRTDAAIAPRPGTNIRTPREHPSAQSHPQLGYRTGESGVLEQKETDT